ncbi:hypothetical protein F4801DRAFT_539702 [Xylaria longipes]|nr:hypothetical protein F4801DRAFT_539702 [Xylaria longipes]
MEQELIFAVSCLVAALVLVIIFNWILQRLIRPIDDQVSRPNALFMPMHQYGLHLQTDVLCKYSSGPFSAFFFFFLFSFSFW